MLLDILKEVEQLSRDKSFIKKYPTLSKFIVEKTRTKSQIKKKRRVVRRNYKEDESSCSDATVRTSAGSDFSDDSDGDGYGFSEGTIRLSDVVESDFKAYRQKIKGRDYSAIGKIMRVKYKERYGYEADPMKHRVKVNGSAVMINSYSENDLDLMRESIQEFVDTKLK